MAAGSCFTLPLCYYFLLLPACSEGSPAEVKLAGSYTARPSHHTRPCTACCRERARWGVVKILVWSDCTQGTMSILTAHIWMLKSVRFSSGSLLWNWKSSQSLLPSNLACLKAGSSLIAGTKDGSTGKQTASIGFPVQEKVPRRGESDKYVQVGKSLS